MNKEILTEFIELYKQRPCLWDNRSSNYFNKHERLAALEELVKILKKSEPDANLSSVRAKINLLRTLYNREKKKVLKSINDNSSDYIYVPNLWCYDLLNFLSETVELKGTARDTINSSISGKAEENVEETPPLKKKIKKNTTQQRILQMTLQNTEETPSLNKKTKRKTKQHRILEIAKEMRNHSNEAVGNCSNVQIGNHTERVRDLDEFDLFGRMIAMELKKLEHPCQAITQKLMSDCLFFAKMGNLTSDSTILTPTAFSESYVLSPYSRTPSPQDSNT